MRTYFSLSFIFSSPLRTISAALAAASLIFCMGSSPALASTETSADDSPDTAGESSQTEVEWDPRIPAYQNTRPQWAVEISSTLNAFGGNSLTVSQGTNPAYGFTFLGEFQPAILQSMGVLGFGPSFGFYPLSKGDLTPSPISLLSVGGQIRYQFRYFREQPLVPVIAYSLEYFKYQYNSGQSGNLVAQGPTVGVWFLLNVLDSSSAAQMFMSTRISRSYAVLEWRNLIGRDSQISYSGGSVYFGLRFEF